MQHSIDAHYEDWHVYVVGGFPSLCPGIRKVWQCHSLCFKLAFTLLGPFTCSGAILESTNWTVQYEINNEEKPVHSPNSVIHS